MLGKDFPEKSHEIKAGERGRRCPDKGTGGQVTQESDRQAGRWAGPEGQDNWASPALVRWGRSPRDSPSDGMGWGGTADTEGNSFGLGNPNPPHLPLADKD